MYLQSIHLTRLVSRLNRVKPQQSEWLTTELFSEECGSPQKPCGVATANLILYPTIIPGNGRQNYKTFEEEEEDKTLLD